MNFFCHIPPPIVNLFMVIKEGQKWNRAPERLHTQEYLVSIKDQPVRFEACGVSFQEETT